MMKSILRAFGLDSLTSVAAKAALTLLLALGATASFGEQGDTDPGGPSVQHVPITTVIRGQPANISAIIEAQQGSVLTSKFVLLRLSDAGTPTKHPMAGEPNNYHVSLPVSLIKSVNVFWYAIDARDDQGRIGGTIWYRVVILDAAEGGGGAGGAAGGSSDEGGAGAAAGGGSGGGSGNGRTAGIIIGGLLLGGGAALIIDNNDGGGKKKGGSTTNEDAPRDGGNKDDNSTPPTVCTVTGGESVSYENLSYYCGKGGDILILVCGTCPDATISAVASWGDQDSLSPFNNPSCSPTAPMLALTPPSQIFARQGGTGGGNFIPVGSETITVFANGVQIDQVVWPPLSDQDCL